MLANAFFRSGMIEAWGRGIERINESLSENGNPAVEYQYSGSDIMVIFNVHPKHIEYNVRPEINPEINPEIKVSLGEIEQAALEVIKKNAKATIDDIAKALTRSFTSAETAVRALREKGIIKRIGSKKSGYWEILK